MTAIGTESEQQWQTWRAERAHWAREPLGWLSLTGLYWLGDAAETVADLPGRWRAAGEKVVVDGADGLVRDGERLSGTIEFAPGEGAPGIRIGVGEREIEIIRRTGQFALRVHDPKAPALAAFREIPAYDFDPRWTVPGVFEPYPAARTVTTGAVVDGLEHHHSAAGTIRFDLDGAEHRLIAFGAADSGLRVLFTDATSGETTYPGARILPVGSPEPDGTVLLDFNRARNLPCSFSDFATCPIAPAENRLPVAVTAGEQDPTVAVAR